MSDGPNKQPLIGDFVSIGGAEALVSRALTLVTHRGQAVRPQPRDLDPRLMQLLETAVLDSDRAARSRATTAMQQAGVPWEDIADRYIPAVARHLGELWCADEMSFVEVTIGSARLQAMLREMGPEWAEETALDPRAPNVVLAQRENDNHTLGTMVVAGQLRRLGVSVRLAIGLSDDAIAETVAAGRFDAVMLSVSCSERLEVIGNLVKKIRRVAQNSPPIVVGGTHVDGTRDVRLVTGADHATSDVLEALKLCGLRVSRRRGETGGSGNGN